MAELIALDLPLGQLMLDEIRRAHDRGRAVCILDQRLSSSRQAEMLATLAPTHIRDESGESRRYDVGRPVEPGDGLVVVTSGTSGAPKAAVLTWTAVIASAEMTSTELYRGVRTRWNACLPPTHVGGFAVLARAIFTDDQVIFGDGGDLALGPSEGATHVAVVRTQLVRHELSSYRVVLLGGSRPPEDLASNVVTTWGMTETGSGVVYNRRALPGVDLAIVDGEIWVHSPTLLRAYRDAPAPFRVGPDGRDGWFATGDAGALHDGELTVFGRLQYVIATGGEKLWPDDLEAVLSRVPGVSDVAVVGVDDDQWGQRVVAFAVSSRSANDLLGEFHDVANEAIGPWAKVKELHLVDVIARTDNGKVAREKLASLAQPTPPLG